MQYDNEKKVLHLVINGQKHEWVHQYITGGEIRKLGGIPAADEIFLKIEKPWEDELINDATKVDLARPGLEHFFSRQEPSNQKIIVNGREKEWDKRQINFQEVVILAFGKFVDKPTMVYTVAYEDGPRQNPDGSMVRGETVLVKNQMIFHATETDKS
jgi:hypothetical protein